MKKFALFGIAGFVAPRHLDAIKKNGCNLIVTLDPNDNVGVLDNYFPSAFYFKELERFDRFLNNQNHSIDFFSICTPNHLHDSHIRYALRNNSNVICEKPIALNPWNIESLLKIEKQTNKKIYPILQLRYHPSVLGLKQYLKTKKRCTVSLTYITPRGNWYPYSWKGDIKKSGGMITNIGVHLFDLLCFLFGEYTSNFLHFKQEDKSSGFLEFKNADVSWYLSTDIKDLLKIGNSQRTYRSINIDHEEFEFSKGFDNLHVECYQQIIQNNGLDIMDTYPSIKIVSDLRTKKIEINRGIKHSFL